LKFDDLKEDRRYGFHTGGTTGRSRSIATWHHLQRVAGDKLLFEETDVQICPLPLFHVFATIVCMGASLSWGRISFPPRGIAEERVR
jgi:acyl-CoA synthetase (AMP-forming)/AMP-acid ligase II